MISGQYLVLSFSAFSGAFFAFFFLRLADFLTKLYQRQLQHYNSLVTLEFQLNEVGGIIHDDLYILPKFIDTISSGNVYFTNLHPIPVDKSHLTNLYNLELLNKLFEYFYDVRKINDDIQTVSQGYMEIKNALIQKNINPNDYKINCENLTKLLRAIEVFLIQMQEDTIQLIAQVRVQMKYDRPLGARLQGVFLKENRAKASEVRIEFKKLEKEIEQSKSKSQKRIESIVNKYNL